ncbi:MAG: tRNA (N(6)-L-threonylcarbamoyladenosine(37)-C(2))-methylthiotransferase MtaB [Victivallales bacterium]|nr:tRNA (N(6)-L-threonylcarbamoyladenosine(37)-C(2))-methylthiotransferase MtaB [Victivallales bacterium]
MPRYSDNINSVSDGLFAGGPTVLVHTLGCRLNQSDSALIFGRLENSGFKIVAPRSEAVPDIVVVNTCAVTALASAKSRRKLRHLRQRYPGALIVAAGCECDLPGSSSPPVPADLLVSNASKPEIAEIIAAALRLPSDVPSFRRRVGEDGVFHENALASFPFKSRAFVKIQEGCNSRCTYCVVPLVRGREVSRDFDEIIEESTALLEAGHKELVLTGVNISTYSCGSKRVCDVLRRLLELRFDFRVRLGSMEPHPENMRIIEMMAENPAICRFLHIPVQSGSDKILQSMGRNYKAADFARFIEFARNKIVGLHLGTDVIVGFPGETDYLFKKTCSFLDDSRFANIHVFRFSPRRNTPAASFPGQVPRSQVKCRAEAVRIIADKSRVEFATSQIGTRAGVLIEKVSGDNAAEGWTDNYLKVKIQSTSARLNSIFYVTLGKGNVLSKR